MRNLKIHKIIAFIIGVIAVYSGYIILPGLPDVYTGWLSYFGQSQSPYPIIITFLYSMVPFDFLLVATLVYLDKRYYSIFPVLLICWLFFVSYTVYLVVILVFIWWFKQFLPYFSTRHSGKEEA